MKLALITLVVCTFYATDAFPKSIMGGFMNGGGGGGKKSSGGSMFGGFPSGGGSSGGSGGLSLGGGGGGGNPFSGMGGGMSGMPGMGGGKSGGMGGLDLGNLMKNLGGMMGGGKGKKYGKKNSRKNGKKNGKMYKKFGKKYDRGSEMKKYWKNYKNMNSMYKLGSKLMKRGLCDTCVGGFHNESKFCLKFSPFTASFHEAHKFCYAHNATLMTPHNQHIEYQTLWNIKANATKSERKYWINVKSIGGKWGWFKGNHSFSYSHWHKEEDKTPTGEKCGFMSTMGWHSEECEKEHHFICQFEMKKKMHDKMKKHNKYGYDGDMDGDDEDKNYDGDMGGDDMGGDDMDGDDMGGDDMGGDDMGFGMGGRMSMNY